MQSRFHSPSMSFFSSILCFFFQIIYCYLYLTKHSVYRNIYGSPKKMLHSLKKCLVRAALVHPQVSFSVLDLESENQLLHTLPSPSPLPLLSNNFGSEISLRLHKVNYSDKELDLSGYLSGPADTCSVKVHINNIVPSYTTDVNSRFVCKGPVHKLINNLASSFCLSSNHQSGEFEFHRGKRQRIQGCPAYLLNLHCPLCSYDLAFEASKTVVEFKDWAFVLSFIEKAVWHIWKQLPACPSLGESHKQTYDTREGISGEDFFTPDAYVPSEMSNKELGFHAHQNLLFHSPFSFSKELPLKDHNSSQRRSFGRLNGKPSGIKFCGHENNFVHQIDYFAKIKTFNLPDIFCVKHDEIISPINLCRERKAFNLQGISGFSHSEIIYSKSKIRPWVSDGNVSAGSHLLSDQITKVDKKDDYLLVSDGERNLTSDSEWNRLKCNLNQNKSQAHTVPFLLCCSRGLDMLEIEHFPAEIIQADSAIYSDRKYLGLEFEERESFSPYDRYLVDTYYSGESSDTPDNNPSKGKLDHMSCLDKTASNKLPTNLMQFPDYHEPYSPERTSVLPRGDNNSIENTFTSQLGYSDEFPGSPKFLSSFFMTDDWPHNVRSEGNYNSFVGLASRQCQTSELVGRFEDNCEDGSREMFSFLDCKDDELCISPVQMVHQNCSSHNIKFEKVACAEINDKSAWLSANFPILKNRSDHSTQAVNLPDRECIDGTPRETFQYCQFSHSFKFNLRSRRSSSAPPFYKHKSKYYTIYDYTKTVKAKDQRGQNSDNDGAFAGLFSIVNMWCNFCKNCFSKRLLLFFSFFETVLNSCFIMMLGSACTLKDLSGPCGTSPPFAKSVSDDPACELLDRTCVDKKASGIEINMVQTNEGSEKDASDLEYSHINMTKWRSGDLYPTSVDSVQANFESPVNFNFVKM
ncbi:hypothetical protein Taro_037747, partial [Colocasia esculenta]|nr:hypothetical protein [Colocasia esculenta]